MENAALLSSRVAACNAPSPFRQDDTYTANVRQPVDGESVGEVRLSSFQREEAIWRAGQAMERAYGDFQLTGHQTDLDRAYRHLEQMRELVAGRAPAVVRQMELERGLA